MAIESSISRRQFVFLGTAATFAALGLSACGGGSGSGSAASGSASSGGLKDGTYEGKSEVHDDGVFGDGYGIITITIDGGQIVDASFQAYEVDDTPKDEDYGRDSAYAVAQAAVSAGDDYVAALVESGSIEGVDAVSGATLLYDQFVEATEAALAQAK